MTAAVRSGRSAPTRRRAVARLNRRVEVEFWYDDPLQELPNEPQMCPEDAGAVTVVKEYDPAWGSIDHLEFVDGSPVVPAGYTDVLKRALDDVCGQDQSAPALRRLHAQRKTDPSHGLGLR